MRRSGNVSALRERANALLLQGRADEALKLADAALGKAAASEVQAVRGDALFALSRYDEALSAFEAASTAGGFEILIKLGIAYKALGRHREGLDVLDRAIVLQPEAPIARFQRGLLRLQLGDFAGGWPDYEARWALDRFVAESRGQVAPGMIPALAVRPERSDLAGQRVLLVGEQGIGDQVMFASAAPDLAGLAKRVTLVCEPRLVRLFSASFAGFTVSGPAEAKIEVDTIDKVVALGSLPHALRRAPEAFAAKPYLAPRADAVGRWSQRLGPRDGRVRIGLSWRGGAASTRGQARSLPLAALAPIVDLARARVFSLQYGDVAAEIEAFNAGRARPLESFTGEDTHDFEDLAGLVANLDLVISVQNTLVHLCGALGRRCLALLPSAPEWRYGAAGAQMPWYGSVRLLRQTTPGDWAPVIAEALAAAREATPAD